MKRFRLRVPATTANLGPGFDCLALALDLHDEIEVLFGGDYTTLTRVEGAGGIPSGTDNLLCRAYGKWAAGLPPVQFHLVSRIPVGRGLGSSAASLVAGLAAACIAGGGLIEEHTERIVALGADLEGHADNVCAAVLGGLTASAVNSNSVHALPVASEIDATVVAFVPNFTLPTRRSRELLPVRVPFGDAVHNLSHAVCLAAALANGQLGSLRWAMSDRLHESARRSLVPHLAPLRTAAMGAGAHGVALSGAGPTVIAICSPPQAQSVARAMDEAAEFADCAGSCLVTRPTPRGVHVQP